MNRCIIAAALLALAAAPTLSAQQPTDDEFGPFVAAAIEGMLEHAPDYRSMVHGVDVRTHPSAAPGLDAIERGAAHLRERGFSDVRRDVVKVCDANQYCVLDGIDVLFELQSVRREQNRLILDIDLHHQIRWSPYMHSYYVTLVRAGGGFGVLSVEVHKQFLGIRPRPGEHGRPPLNPPGG